MEASRLWMRESILRFGWRAHCTIAHSFRRQSALAGRYSLGFGGVGYIQTGPLASYRERRLLMIPKTVHYCWFGGSTLGPDEERCIASWRQYLPGYEIQRWDESNFDVRCCPYVSEAYDAKKWAFVSDYARFRILYEAGGLYFDTDVEIIRSLDGIIEQGPFMGCETGGEISSVGTTGPAVNPGLGLACGPGNDLFREVMESYHQDHFVRPDGEMNLTTIVDRVTMILREKGLSVSTGIQDVAGVRVYPPEYFCPVDWYTGEVNITPKTRSIHHFTASWLVASRRTEDRIRKDLLSRHVNPSVARQVARLMAIVLHLDFERVLGKARKAVHRER